MAQLQIAFPGNIKEYKTSDNSGISIQMNITRNNFVPPNTPNYIAYIYIFTNIYIRMFREAVFVIDKMFKSRSFAIFTKWNIIC